MTAPLAAPKINHSEEHFSSASRWLNALDPKTVVFYAKPLIQKWLKTFKTPVTTIVSAQALGLLPWEKKIKPQLLSQIKLEEALASAAENPASTELLVLMAEEMPEDALETLLGLLKKGGAFLWVTQNRHRDWKQLSDWLEAHEVSQLFPVGFHPKGAIAWWPFNSPWLVWLGYLVDGIAPFFPGRYQTGLRFGRYWLIRGIKRYDRTEWN